MTTAAGPRRLAAGAVMSLFIHAAAALTHAALHRPGRAPPPQAIEIEPVRVSLDHLPAPAFPSPRRADARPRSRRVVTQRRPATALPPQTNQGAVLATAGKIERVEASPQPPSERPGVTLLVQLDRARESSIGARLAEMLISLPDGGDLLGATGLDTLDAFDALLVATPDPADARATVLAARHRLQDSELRAAFARGAAATNRVVNWRDDARYAFGQRRAAIPRPGASPDNRLFILPEPGVVVVTTPAYLRMLFAAPRTDGATPEDDPWRALPAPRHTGGEGPAAAGPIASVTVAGDRAASILGLTGARAFTVAAATVPEPVVSVTAHLASDADAMHAEGAWPELRDKLNTTSLMQAADLVPAFAGARLTRDGHDLRLDVPVTEAELLRLLQVVATSFGAAAPR